jgi:hypothetical protein
MSMRASTSKISTMGSGEFEAGGCGHEDDEAGAGNSGDAFAGTRFWCAFGAALGKTAGPSASPQDDIYLGSDGCSSGKS